MAIVDDHSRKSGEVTMVKVGTHSGISGEVIMVIVGGNSGKSGAWAVTVGRISGNQVPI